MSQGQAEDLLLTAEEVRDALGPTIQVTPGATDLRQGLGDVLRAAARSSAYRRFDGHTVAEGEERPLAVGSMALVFTSSEVAENTFRSVASAAHLQTDVDGTSVAVETVTSPSGLVSYWGFIHRGAAIVVVTLDTVDPQRISVSDLRSLVTSVAKRLHSTQPQ